MDSDSPSDTRRSLSVTVVEPLCWRDHVIRYPSLPAVVRCVRKDVRQQAVVQDVYVHSTRSEGRLLVEQLRIGDGHRVTTTGQFFSVSFEYKGWFEVLSQDGHAIRGFDSVEKLVKAFPKRCLVQRSVVGFRLRGGSDEHAVDSVCVEKGMLLDLVEVKVVLARNVVGDLTSRRVLVCTNTSGEQICLDVTQRGSFHPVAGSNDITGVHDVQSLLAKFRLPIIVRVVIGNVPNGCSGVFRLLTAERDGIYFGFSFGNGNSIVRLFENDTSVKFLPDWSSNANHMTSSNATFERRCHVMILDDLNTFHSLTPVLQHGRPKSARNIDGIILVDRSGRPLVGNKPSDSTTLDNQLKVVQSQPEEDRLLREIEDIYMGVRGSPAFSPSAVGTLPPRVAQSRSLSRDRAVIFTTNGHPPNTMRTISYTAGAVNRQNMERKHGLQASQSFTFKKDQRLASDHLKPYLFKATSAFCVDAKDAVPQAGNNDQMKLGYNTQNNNRENSRLSPIELRPVSSQLKKQSEDLGEGKFHRHGKDRQSAAYGLIRHFDPDEMNRHNTSFSENVPLPKTNLSVNTLRAFPLKRSDRWDPVYEEIKPSFKSKKDPVIPDGFKYLRKFNNLTNTNTLNKGVKYIGTDRDSRSFIYYHDRTGQVERPKSFAGPTNLDYKIIDNYEFLNGGDVPPVPPKRCDSLVDLQLMKESTAEPVPEPVHTEPRKRTKSISGGVPIINSKVSYAAEKFGLLSRALLKTYRRVKSRSSHNLSGDSPTSGRCDTEVGESGQGNKSPAVEEHFNLDTRHARDCPPSLVVF